MIKKKIIMSIILFSLVISGCSINETEPTENLISLPEEDKYSIIYFSDGDLSESITEPLWDYYKVVDIYITKNPKNSLSRSYNVDEFPTIIVFDHQGIVLRTNNIDDVFTYLNENE
jgi:thioredoxin-related protein